MRTNARRSGGRRARLSRERVLLAALDVADERGIESLTMREVGERLGAEAMSLYRHVRNKEDILDGIVDLVFAEIELPPSEVDWKTAMRRRAISARQVLARHPWATALMESRTRPGPANMRHHDAVLGSLRAAGFSSLTATRAFNIVNSYVYGFALQEASLPVATPDQLQEVAAGIISRMPADEYPNLRLVGIELMAAGFDYGQEFEAGLDLILDGLEGVRLTGIEKPIAVPSRSASQTS
jgi:AcrR family transcriptional regulator